MTPRRARAPGESAIACGGVRFHRARRVRVVVTLDVDCVGSTDDLTGVLDAMLDDGWIQDEMVQRTTDSDSFGPMFVADANVSRGEVQ